DDIGGQVMGQDGDELPVVAGIGVAESALDAVLAKRRAHELGQGARDEIGQHGRRSSGLVGRQDAGGERANDAPRPRQAGRAQDGKPAAGLRASRLFGTAVSNRLHPRRARLQIGTIRGVYTPTTFAVIRISAMRFSLSGLSARLNALLITSFLAFQAGAAPAPAGVSEVASVEGITEYRLSNGLRVLLAPDASKPTTTVNMTYLVGSRQENYGQTGMAHLLEHMLFKSTPTTRNALGEFSRRGLQANGSTSADRTNYFASFAANPDTLKWYLSWQADAMVNSLIAKEDLD